MKQMFDEMGELPPGEVEAARAWAEESVKPPESPAIRRFLEEDWSGLQSEWEILLKFDTPAPRVVTYERVTEGETHVDEADCALGKRISSPWNVAKAAYMPPDFLPAGLSELRDAMDTMGSLAQSPEAVSVWMAPFDAPDGSTALLLFFRDDRQREDVFMFVRNELRRVASGTKPVETLLGRGQVMKDNIRLVDELSGSAARESCNAYFGDAGVDTLTDGQWAGFLDWAKASITIRNALVAVIYQRTEQLMDEADFFLFASSRSVADLTDMLRRESRAALDELEKLHEKRLNGHRGDVDKMRMLTEGIQKRADRTDKDNQGLRRQLRAAEVQAPAGASAASAVSDGGRVKKALDSYF
ncbi:hypothetical protein B0G84_8555 [Paraburkholderia sp. BL8N3]|nr:hypothetical protein [Paraburkholderia sp. BL8N3]TCK32703.1 hypothetical protein B0G84_8555 [Paraburkholderia sp. BL8N3]